MNATANQGPLRSGAVDKSAERAERRTQLGRWFVRSLVSGRIPALLIAIGCGVLLYGVLTSPDFNVDRIVVSGIERGEPSEIVSRADISGKSVFWIDPDAVSKNLASLPYVGSIEVSIAYPSEVRVDVVERQPVMVYARGARLFEVDEHGNVLRAVESTALPKLQGSRTDVAVGGQIPDDIVASVLAINTALASYGGNLRWSDPDGLTLELDQRTVILGEPDQMPAKLAVFQQVYAEIQDDSWTTLDVRAPDRPVYQ